MLLNPTSTVTNGATNSEKDKASNKPPSSYGRSSGEEAEIGSLPPSYDHTHRKLKSRHIQLIGIGGTIGTALYVQIGRGLTQGGPLSLFLAFTFWCTVVLALNLSLAEMVTYLPISSPFIRFAGRYVDEAFGVAAGYNFFIFQAALVPFEIVACNIIIHYWTKDIHVGIVIACILVIYGLANIFAVKWYGESEFWLALGKVLLIVGLIAFTFVTMLGANPLGDRYGFRYWKNPGPVAEYIEAGSLGRFMGFLACLIQASFTIAGPDYVSMAAGEAQNPRVVMPRAFNAVFYRLTFFFILGSLCVGIVVPHDDPILSSALSDGKPGAAASPYVIAMDRMKIPILPHIVNALVLTSAFSAGNSYVFCASRSLYGLALEGKAPRIFTVCTASGVPIYSVFLVLGIGLLSYLQVSNSAAVVLSWFVSLVTASQLINFSVMALTFISFHRALAAQGIPRVKPHLPYIGWFQPYLAYYALSLTSVMSVVGGYTVFLPGRWDVPTFIFSYFMIFLFPIVFVGWKFYSKSVWLMNKPEQIVLGGKEKEEVDAYEREYVESPPRSKLIKWWDFIFG